jgi:CHASE3 domain sensor protein
MTHQKLEEKKAELKSYLGQLTDLEAGRMEELVLKPENIKAIKLLKEAISIRIEQIDEFIELDKQQDIEEAVAAEAPDPDYYDPERVNPDLMERETNDVKEDNIKN